MASDRVTLSEKCRQHGLMMPMPDAGGCCWYCADELGGGSAPPADPIGDALRADAEAARAEIRAAGIICPSCEVNMADLPRDHKLTWDMTVFAPAKCAWGPTVRLTAYEQVKAAANIAIWDGVNAAVDEDLLHRERKRRSCKPALGAPQ